MSADFTVPAEMLPMIQDLKGQLRFTSQRAAMYLMAAGLTPDQAYTVIVDILVEGAASIAMASAIAEGRDPEKDRWQETTAAKYDAIHALLVERPGAPLQ